MSYIPGAGPGVGESETHDFETSPIFHNYGVQHSAGIGEGMPAHVVGGGGGGVLSPGEEGGGYVQHTEHHTIVTHPKDPADQITGETRLPGPDTYSEKWEGYNEQPLATRQAERQAFGGNFAGYAPGGGPVENSGAGLATTELASRGGAPDLKTPGEPSPIVQMPAGYTVRGAFNQPGGVTGHAGGTTNGVGGPEPEEAPANTRSPR
ncbi:hypothetical protein KGP36_01705 [Patescibacteria group bacterium]|nr:hypothetical protein [Patescibacteria group bacterium]